MVTRMHWEPRGIIGAHEASGLADHAPSERADEAVEPAGTRDAGAEVADAGYGRDGSGTSE
jgi:hypothetical protein